MGFDPASDAARQAMERVGNSGAALCFLALGAPKQELLAQIGRKTCPHTGFLAIGAALDFIAGHQQRAPRWMQRLGLEWLYRLAHQPRRLAGRYARSALIFASLALRQMAGQPGGNIGFVIGEKNK